MVTLNLHQCKICTKRVSGIFNFLIQFIKVSVTNSLRTPLLPAHHTKLLLHYRPITILIYLCSISYHSVRLLIHTYADLHVKVNFDINYLRLLAKLRWRQSTEFCRGNSISFDQREREREREQRNFKLRKLHWSTQYNMSSTACNRQSGRTITRQLILI